jgi:hypothetical protein
MDEICFKVDGTVGSALMDSTLCRMMVVLMGSLIKIHNMLSDNLLYVRHDFVLSAVPESGIQRGQGLVKGDWLLRHPFDRDGIDFHGLQTRYDACAEDRTFAKEDRGTPEDGFRQYHSRFEFVWS